MFKKIFLGLGLAVVMSISVLPQQSHAQQAGTYDPASMINPLSFMGGAGGQAKFNLARPSGWSVFMNPATYPQLMNPATYTQFMQPQFWMQFADPNNMMSWMNPMEYMAYMNPMTYMNMMNPMAYMGFMNPATYMAPMNPASYVGFINPATYMSWLNPGSYTIPGITAPVGAATGATGFNFFDPATWTQMMTAPAAPAQTAPAPKQ
jgi:hypothetical protein